MQNGDGEQYLGKPTRAPLQLHRPISYPRVIIVDVPNPCPCREILSTMSLTSLTFFDLVATFCHWRMAGCRMAFDDVFMWLFGSWALRASYWAAFAPACSPCLPGRRHRKTLAAAVFFPEYVPILPELKDSHSCLKEWHESPERGWNISKICVAEKCGRLIC